jgi:hypothetical protein
MNALMIALDEDKKELAELIQEKYKEIITEV